jgi:hypothetical protein
MQLPYRHRLCFSPAANHQHLIPLYPTDVKDQRGLRTNPSAYALLLGRASLFTHPMAILVTSYTNGQSYGVQCSEHLHHVELSLDLERQVRFLISSEKSN